MLALPGVTLCCVDTANHALALRALARSTAGIAFGRVLFLTAGLPPGLPVPAGITVVPIAPLDTRDAYSQFMLKSLLPHVATAHVLVVQWDGFVIDPGAWDPAFLQCDYIGAKWDWHADGMRVGNGGFSLRSRRLLAALQDPAITLAGNEDETICRMHRPRLERDFGITFADERLAERFSFEASYPVGAPFGFHGLFNFCRFLPPDEIAAMVGDASDAIAQSVQMRSLLRNCQALGQRSAVVAIATRMLAAAPDDGDALAALAPEPGGAATRPAAGRNDPCPCGSGKRYKHCHGAATAPIASTDGPGAVDAIVARALAAHQHGDIDAAERDYRRALEAAPGHPTALHYLGVVLYQRNRLAEALPLLLRAVSLAPAEPEFHNNLGLALAAADRTADAIAAHRQAIARKPDHAGAGNNLGLALQAANDLPAAIGAFRRALEIAPGFAQAHWNLGLALLANGEFAEGWREYEWRLAIDDLGKRNRAYPGPRWDGSAAAGKTILLTREQGLGDTLQFARFARRLADRGARVIMEVPPPLVGLIARVPGVAGACSPDDPLPAFDAHIPLLSVAGALGVDAGSIPHEVPYVTADPQAATAIAAALDRTTWNVGVAWSGNRNHSNDRRRSLPLAALAALFAAPGTAWYSLQMADDEAEIAAVPAARSLVRLDARNSMDGKAALVAALDLVITVDTSTAHLAGAMGRPVWLLLPFAADWRWQQQRADSPWYPTMRLFRQPRAGDWPAVIAAVAQALAARAAAR